MRLHVRVILEYLPLPLGQLTLSIAIFWALNGSVRAQEPYSTIVLDACKTANECVERFEQVADQTWDNAKIPSVEQRRVIKTAVKRQSGAGISLALLLKHENENVRRLALEAFRQISLCEIDACTYRSVSHHLVQHNEKVRIDLASLARVFLDVAQDATVSEDGAGWALYYLSLLGPEALVVENELITLRSLRPSLSTNIDDALIGIHSPETGQIFARRIQKANENQDAIHGAFFRDLAATGSAGRAAGPAVLDYLNNADWDARISAVRTLGFIDYQEAAEALVPLLTHQEDVRLNWAAAEALGRLHIKSTLTALETAANSHWHPTVRAAAKDATTHIEQGSLSENPISHFPSAFFSYFLFEQPACKSPSISRATDQSVRKIRAGRDLEEISILKYQRPLLYVDRDPTFMVPKVAIQVDDGWLGGTDFGEWGGELVHFDEHENPTILLEENNSELHLLGDKLIAVTGLAHLSFNRGRLYIVERNDSGLWKANSWRALPGAPEDSWLTEKGELFVDTVQGGEILISADGTMRLAPCKY